MQNRDGGGQAIRNEAGNACEKPMSKRDLLQLCYDTVE